MRDIAWRSGLTSLVLSLLLILAPKVEFTTAQPLFEASRQTPQAQIENYLDAIVHGDRQAALDHWLPPDGPATSIGIRDQAVTDALLAYGPRLNYRLLKADWWHTCYQPALENDPGARGRARVQVIIGTETGPDTIFIFDLLPSDIDHSQAVGHPAGPWSISDAYPAEERSTGRTWR
jgi:hypothetical protein